MNKGYLVGRMGGKICFILALFIFFVFTTTVGNEENNISKDSSSLRLSRSSDSVRKGRSNKKNSKKKRRNQKNKKRKNKNKRGNNKVQKKGNKDSRTHKRMVDGACLESATISLNIWRNQVTNFQKQMARVKKQAEIAGKKSGKQDVFGPIAKKLIDVGGGNKSALTCSGSADSDGAKQLANLTMTLNECAKEINMTCNQDTFPKPDMTLINTCTDSVESFEKEAKKCFDLSKEATVEDACTCWTSEDMKKYTEEVKNCKIAEVGAIAKGLKDCKASFSKCRKYEDDTISSIQSCSQSADQLKSKVEALAKNKEALNDVKNKIAKATSSSSRAPATDCAGFVSLVLQSNLMINHNISNINLIKPNLKDFFSFF